MYQPPFGHASAPNGTDCSAIDGVNDVSCNKGTCSVATCQKGWSVNENGDGCTKGVLTRKVTRRAKPVAPRIVRKGEPAAGEIPL